VGCVHNVLNLTDEKISVVSVIFSPSFVSFFEGTRSGKMFKLLFTSIGLGLMMYR
jgi:hypothetical protein